MADNKDHIDLVGWDLHRAAKEDRVDIARHLTSLREIEDRDRQARIDELLDRMDIEEQFEVHSVRTRVESVRKIFS
tara:strand:+ start:1014 stop:1241 length:228 start_codon:yes stop_codon:yes gene_type:complete